MPEPIFTFALIADTHLNPVDGKSGSPWPSNALANDRARWTVAALNADKPDFVIHLGDMIHPVPAQESYPIAAERFHAIFDQLDAPLHLLPGNHDIGDKPGDWMPAHIATKEAVKTYRETFGAPWSVFDHGQCRFILHCNPILGSGLPEDAEQWAWLQQQLDEAGDKRIFFMTHYPLFLTDMDEPEHYDNLAPEPRERLRRMLVDAGAEAVFAAHVHNLFHTPLADTDNAPMQHVLSSISALRLDYSYLFRSPLGADQEFGRNDAQKLSYYLVDVMEEGYRLRLRRTNGAVLSEEQDDDLPQTHQSYPEDIRARPLGVDLRHGWAQPVAVPYTGVVDEFRRKYVHNDHLIAALQEAGIRDLRVPIDDLRDARTRARMRDLGKLGHAFQLFTIEPPTTQDIELLGKAAKFVSGIEVIARPENLRKLLPVWRSALDQMPIDVLASRMWSSADIPAEAVQFAHGIGHGFFVTDHALIDEFASGSDGLVIFVGPEDDPSDLVAKVPSGLSSRLVFYLCLRSADPASCADDDARQTKRIVKGLDTVRLLGAGATLMLDTLDDHNRGYYPRHGLYDGQFNPRDVAKTLSRTGVS